jgi:lysophospholipid acyltransferase (LPLAT)-like uncharacterized protein
MLKAFKYFLILRFFPPLIYAFLVLLRLTFRIEHINRQPIDERWKRGENFIFCFWHGRLLLMPYADGRKRGKVLISRHRDGEFIARVVSYFGLGSIRGSHRKGSVSSLREIITDLRNGFDVAITPDGPKGPRYKVKTGIVELAKLTGKAIVPITYSAVKKKAFHSWDNFVFPYPFSKILFLWGNPISVERNAGTDALETKRLELENTLVKLTESADKMACGN